MKQGQQIDYRAMVHRMADMVEDEAVLRRVWKILERAYEAQ